MYELLFLTEHYTILQGAENLRFCMTGEVRIDKITAGRALCYVQTVRTMMQFIISWNARGLNGPKWKSRGNFCLDLKYQIYSKSPKLLRRWKNGRTNGKTRSLNWSLTLWTVFTNKPYTFFFVYVLLTVHLSIFILVINQLDAQNFVFQ